MIPAFHSSGPPVIEKLGSPAWYSSGICAAQRLVAQGTAIAAVSDDGDARTRS